MRVNIFKIGNDKEEICFTPSATLYRKKKHQEIQDALELNVGH